MPSMRIVTTSAVFLALAAGSASAQKAIATAPAQTATTTAPGKPLQLFQIVEQKDGAAVTPHHRVRYVKRKATGRQIAHHKAGPTRDTFMEVQPTPEPEQAATAPAAITPPPAPAAAVAPAATTAAVPANIWPAPDTPMPSTQAQSLTLTPPTAPTAPDEPAAAANQNEMLTAAYHAVQVTPPNAAQASPPDSVLATPPSAPQVDPPATVQIAQADTVSPTDVTADQPHDATNAAKTSSRAASWPVQRAMFARAEPQNPNPVGSVSWIVHVLAALGATIAAGAVAWFLIDPLPARSYE